MTDAADEPPQIGRLKAVLRGLEGLPSRASCDVDIDGSQYDPPSYVVKLVLLVLGVPHFKTEEKSEWQVYVKFEGFRFRISDWKRSSWSVCADTREPAAAVAGRKMVRKIRAAAKLLDVVLSASLSEQVQGGEFFLHNTYPKIRRAYEHFRDLAQVPIESAKHAADSSGADWLSDKIASLRASETSAALNGYAAAGFYYALLEVLLDVMYALGPRAIDFVGFKRLKWREKFAHVLPTKTDPVLARLYGQVLRTKREFRDPVLHGLGGDDALLVDGPAGAGLIPVSYEALGRSMSFSTVEGDAERAKMAFEVFRATDQWLEANPPACFALEFARSGFAIPFHSERVAEIVSNMTDMRSFRAWLAAEAQAEDERLEYW